MADTTNEALASIAVLSSMAPRRLAEASRVARGLGFAAGDRLYQPGDHCERVVFVTSGQLRVTKAGATGREIELYRVGPGEACILELSAALSGTRYPAHAVASEQGSALALPVSAMLELLAADRGVQRGVFGLLAERLGEVMAIVEEVAFRRLDERLPRLLWREARGDPPAVRLTHQALADRLGTAREVVSRLLAQMAHEGEITLSRGEIVLLHPPSVTQVTDAETPPA